MMKNKYIIVVVVLLLLVVSGCGKSNRDLSEMVGTYELIEYNNGSKTYKESDLRNYKQMYHMNVFVDKQIEIEQSDGKHYLRYDANYLYATTKDKKEEKVKYSYKDGIIKIKYNKKSYTYKKMAVVQ